MWGETLDSRISEAVDVAERADVVVLVWVWIVLLKVKNQGTLRKVEINEICNYHCRQRMLLEAMGKVDRPIVFVGLVGSAMDYSFAKENANAIVQAWYPGQMGGKALADLLFGVRDFSGTFTNHFL